VCAPGPGRAAGRLGCVLPVLVVASRRPRNASHGGGGIANGPAIGDAGDAARRPQADTQQAKDRLDILTITRRDGVG